MRNILKDTRLLKAGLLSLIAIALALLLIFSCNNLLVLGSGGTLIVSVPGGRYASDATIYTIDLNGTSGAIYSKTIPAGQTAAFEELVPDTYTILVKGSNEKDIVVYYGSSTATVEAGKTSSAMVELMDLLGKLSVEFSGATNGKNFSVDLKGASGLQYTKTVLAGEPAQFERLMPDIYTIDVHGTNANNAVLYHGIDTATVEMGKKTSATVDLVVEATDFAGLKEGIESGGIVYVLNDITVTERLTVNKNVEIRALNKNVTLNLASDVLMFEVGSGGELTLGGGEYMLTVNGNKKNQSNSLLNIDGGKVHLYGTITNSYSSETGIEIKGSSSILNIYDGATISNCECTASWGRGGAIAVRSGAVMNMYGGTITGSTADFGAAVYINDGTFTMSGGTISGNTGNQNDSAVEVSGTFKMGGSAMFGSNDKVYLANKNTSRFIKVISPLTGTGPVATIISDISSSGTIVLTAGDGVILANEVGKFVLTSGTIKSDGTLQ